MHKNCCLRVIETLGSVKCPNCSAIPRVSQPLITSENAVCKLPHHVHSPCDCAHKYSHEIWRTGLLAPSLSNPAGSTRQGWECPVGCYHFIWLFVEEKHVWHIAFETPSLPYLENNTNWIQHDKLHEPWIQSWENRKGRLVCCPSNPDYLFKPKFNFLIKCWKKSLQQRDYSWKKVQGTNKLPPPAPSQTVLAV